MPNTRMQEIETRLAAIRSEAEQDGADLTALNTETDRLLNERSAIIDTANSRQTLLSRIASSTGGVPVTPTVEESRGSYVADVVSSPEYRGAYWKNLLGRDMSQSEQRAFAEARAFSTASGSAAAAIPTDTANAIIRKAYEVAPIIERCRIFHMPGNLKFPVENVNDMPALHTENASISAAGDSLAEISLTGYEIVKLVKCSRASVAMTVAGFESYIVDIIGSSFGRKLENYILTGTGSSQPGSVAQGGKGTGGAYTSGTDMVEIAAATDMVKGDIEEAYGMLGSGYERNAVWVMSKTTFFAYFHPLMDLSTHNVISFANGKYYILGCEVYFSGSLTKGIVYFGDFNYIVGNFSQEVVILRSEHSGLATNSIDYLGACVFDCRPAAGLGAFVKLNKKQS